MFRTSQIHFNSTNLAKQKNGSQITSGPQQGIKKAYLQGGGAEAFFFFYVLCLISVAINNFNVL